MALTLRERIEQAWAARDTLVQDAPGDAREAVEAALSGLEDGSLRVAEPGNDGWIVNSWLKMAVLLAFRLNRATVAPGIAHAPSFDKMALKFENWSAAEFEHAGFRALPGALVRRSAFVAPGVVLMPCFVNAGARIGENTMIDTWSTIGSCAQIGRNCHVSGGVGIGGVLEPLQANPVIIEDDCFIGARSEVAEGFVVGRGSVISMGVFLGASTKVIDRATGAIHRGSVPPYSVVVPGSLPATTLPDGTQGPSLGCAVIVKRVDAGTRSKTSINDLLRD